MKAAGNRIFPVTGSCYFHAFCSAAIFIITSYISSPTHSGSIILIIWLIVSDILSARDTSQYFLLMNRQIKIQVTGVTNSTCISIENITFSILCIAVRYTFAYNKVRKVVCTMATKTANVMARVEPQVKEQAEAIMEMLGIPASVVINTLYKQIIMPRSIPFSLSVPAAPVARDEMDEAAFNTMLMSGLNEAKADQSREAGDVFADLRREMQ